MTFSLDSAIPFCVAAVVLATAIVIQTRQCFRIYLSDENDRLATEFALMLHMTLQFGCVFSALSGHQYVALFIDQISFPVEPLLYLNVPILAFCIYQTIQHKSVEEAPGLLLIASNLPAVFHALGDLWWLLPALDAFFFLFRAMYCWYLAANNAARPTRQDLASAVNMLPTGLMFANKNGDALYMNEEMRTILGLMGLRADLADARLAIEAFGLGADANEQTKLTLDNGDTYLLSIDTQALPQEDLYAITAYDITSQESLSLQLKNANEDLAKRNDELQQALHVAESSARAEATLQMKSRIHDVVGQRLSILHRCLEDDNLSQETIDQMRPILENLIQDLDPVLQLNPAQELETVIEAFSLIGVQIRMSGLLPDDPTSAALFVRAIREGGTNAVKHAQASYVSAVCGSHSNRWSLSIENSNPNGKTADALGTGLSELKERTERLGGTMTIDADEFFKLRISVPKM